MGQRWAPGTSSSYDCWRETVSSHQQIHHKVVRWFGVEVNLREDYAAPACNGSEKTRSQVSGWIYSIATIEAHRQPND